LNLSAHRGNLESACRERALNLLIEKALNLLLEMCVDVGSICHTMSCDTKFNKRCRSRALSEFCYDAVLTLRSLKLVLLLPEMLLQCLVVFL
jgi:hypothetical protein